MKKIYKGQGFKFSITMALIIGLNLNLYSRPVFADKDDPGNTTICADTASRNVATGGNDKIAVGEKVKTGSRPLFLAFNSTIQNAWLNNFSSNNISIDLIKAPAAGCSLSFFQVNLDASCRLTGPIQVKFSCNSNLYDLNDPAIDPGNTPLTLFNKVRNVLGLDSALGFPASCNAVDPNNNDNSDEKACAHDICQSIKDQLNNGNSLALSTAGDVGQLIGSMQTTLARCFASNQQLVHFNGAGASCTPDQVAAATAFDLLLGAPQEHVQLDSSGTGSYLVSILASSTVFTPGDFVSIDMNTCAADFNLQ